MKQAIQVRTIRFLLTQALIIVGIMAAFIILLCVFFIRNATHWHLVNIEEDLRIFAEQAARSGEIPKRGDLGAYTFFILNADGKYILPRLPRSDDSENIWQEYELKIIYEMQKRREGWSYYPQRGRWDFRNGQYMLRYIYIAKTGWIVAGEGYMPGAMTLLNELLTPPLFIGMGFIALAAFVFMLFNANWHFHRVIRAILRSQENNFIAVDGVPASVSKKEPRVLLRPEERLPVGGSDGMIRGPARRASPVPEEAPVSHVPPEVTQRIETPMVEINHRREDLGAVAIVTSDIRSPVLRRAIEELREAKR